MLRGDFLSLVKTDVPMTAALCQQTLQALVNRYPFLRLELLTETPLNRRVWTLTMGTGNRHVLFTAAHHANEWITTPVLLKFAEDVAQAWEAGNAVAGSDARNLLETATIHLVPMVNPDGVDLVTGGIAPGTPEYGRAKGISANYPQIPFPDGWKADLQGVDLNLQYPAGWLEAREIKFAEGYTRPAPRDYVGRWPLSQRETAALAEYTEDVDPALVLAFHTQGQVIYWQFRDYQIPGARLLGEEFARLSGYTLAETPYESSFAGYKDWFIQKFRRPGYTIEAGLGENPLPLSQFDEIYRDNLGILVTAASGLTE